MAGSWARGVRGAGRGGQRIPDECLEVVVEEGGRL